MMIRPKCLSALMLTLILAPFMVAHAQWSSDPASNNPVCRAGNFQKAPQLVSDENGGAIITWSDERDAQYFFKVYAQRIDRDGFVQWKENGIAISPFANAQSEPEIIPDGAGGAIITWAEARFGDMDIYAQRIDPSGKKLWEEDGVLVASGNTVQIAPKLASDGQHGAIITWSASTGTNQDGHIYAQRVDANGTLQWSPELALSFSDQFESSPSIASDGSGGAYIAWAFYNNQEYDIYAQRVTAGGAAMWQGGGLGIATNGGAQDLPILVADGTGKAFLAYSDLGSGSTATVKVVILNPDGSQAASLDVASTGGGQTNPHLSRIGSGLLGITWEDGRKSGDTRAYAQIIDNAGQTSWAANGLEVSNRSGDQATPSIISDGNGGVIVSWEDKTAGLTESDVYAQRISTSGSLLWGGAGVPVSTAGRMQQYPGMVGDGQNGAVIAWQDYRPSFSNPEIYASRILADGTFPKEPPVLEFSTKSLAFGAVSVGSFLRKPITLSNTGDEDVTITAVNSSDAHFSLAPADNTIPPGGNVTATAEFRPTSKDALTAYIVVESNSIFGPDTVMVTGSGTASPSIDTDRNSLAFGDVLVGTSRSLAVNISNPGNDTLIISDISTDNAVYTVAIATMVLAPGEAFHDTVRFTPAAPGAVAGELTITSNAPTSPTVLPLSGNGTEIKEVRITIEPVEVAFGEVALGTSRDTTVTITNTGNDTLRISSFASGDPAFTLETPIGTVAPGASTTFTLRFTPVSSGPLSTVFTVTSNAVDSPHSIAVDGTGRDLTDVRRLRVSPNAFTLHQNYPNPFHGSTSVRFDIETSAPVRLTVHDTRGRVVAILIDATERPGSHEVQWTPAAYAPGVYYLVLRVGPESAYGRMVLLP